MSISFTPNSGKDFTLLARVLLPLWLLCAASSAEALQLPAPEALEKDPALHRQSVEVVEPHSSTPERQVRITYVGVPVAVLLTRWFGDAWKAPGVEVEFLALDGYRSTVPASKLSSLPAFLATARADGAPFELNNWEQKERVPLGPYYLIWDNLKVPELQRQGSSGWPYQVARIRLRQAGDDATLRPPEADAETLLGQADTAANCLTCHHLRGIGGEKYPKICPRCSAGGPMPISNAGLKSPPGSVPVPRCQPSTGYGRRWSGKRSRAAFSITSTPSNTLLRRPARE